MMKTVKFKPMAVSAEDWVKGAGRDPEARTATPEPEPMKFG
jgi:hypothetical protein